jgi:hypothetical protein
MFLLVVHGSEACRIAAVERYVNGGANDVTLTAKHHVSNNRKKVVCLVSIIIIMT